MENKVHPAQVDLREHRRRCGASSSPWACRSTGRASSPPALPTTTAHQQKLFLDFLKKGLAYRKSSKVNWDPVDHTVLANEQVIDGRGWRSGALVEQRELTQWFFKITEYADELLEALDDARQVAGEGAPDAGELDRPLRRPARALRARQGDRAQEARARSRSITTRPDTLFGASFIALSPDHPLAKAAAKDNPKLAAFCEECRHMGTSVAELETAEKQGFDTGIRAVHPFDKNWKLPVYVANFILMEYGTGAIFGCPSGDQRDLDFARKYGCPFVPVVLPPGDDAATFAIADKAYRRRGHDDQLELPRRARYQGGVRGDRPSGSMEKLGEAVGKRKVNYRLRDWGISRQRYWGCPIPVIHCETVRHRAGAGRGPAGRAAGRRDLRQAGQPARPPPDLEAREVPEVRRGRACARPTPWTPSSTAPGTSCASPRPTPKPVDKAAAGYWLPVDQYIGGIEHAILHLLYSRFFTRAMWRHRAPQIEEQRARAVRGAVHAGHGHARDLQVASAADWLLPAEVRIEGEGDKRKARSRRRRASRSTIGPVEKMSKSRKNVVDLDDFISQLRRRRRALVHALRQPARARRHLYGRRRRRRAALHAAHLAADRPGARAAAAKKGAAKPASFGPEATALRRAAHKTLNSVASTSRACASTWPWPSLRVHKCSGLRPGENRGRPRLGACARRRVAGADDRPDDAASGGGMLGAARIQHLAGRSALAEAEAGLLVDDTITIAVQVNGKRRDELTIARTAVQ